MDNNKFLCHLSSENSSAEVIFDNDPTFQSNLDVWNKEGRSNTPLCVVNVKTVGDVQAVVNFCRDNSVPFKTRVGGHNFYCDSISSDCLIIDLKSLNKIEINENDLTCTFEGGCLQENVTKEIFSKGYFFPVGSSPEVGATAFLCGGGVSTMLKKYGLSCDYVLEAKIVTANGLVVVASPKQNEKLFWAIRGAGVSGLGIVVSMKIQLIDEKPKKGYFGRIWYPMSSFETVVDAMADWYANDNLNYSPTLWTLCDHFDDPSKKGPHFCLMGTFLGEDLDELSPFLTLPGAENFLKLREDFDEAFYEDMEVSRERLYLVGNAGSILRKRPTEEQLKNFARLYGKTVDMKIPFAEIYINFFGGKAKIEQNDCFSHRDKCMEIHFFGQYTDHDLEHNMTTTEEEARSNLRNWLNLCEDYLYPLRSGLYINFPISTAQCDGKLFWGVNYCRLQQLKTEIDPKNIFAPKHGILPLHNCERKIELVEVGETKVLETDSLHHREVIFSNGTVLKESLPISAYPKLTNINLS